MRCQSEWGRRWLAKTGAFLALLFCCAQAGWAQNKFQLHVSTANGIHGMVVGTGGIYCDSNNGSGCSAIFEKDSPVTLTAIPAPGYQFSNWGFNYSNPCSGATTSTCTFPMDRTLLVYPNFVPGNYAVAPINPLTVSVEGGGTVHGGGIHCGTQGNVCSTNVPTTAGQDFQAIPDPGYIFTGWRGKCFGTADKCTVFTNDITYVHARFTPQTAPVFTLEVDSGENGYVRLDPIGSDCQPGTHYNCLAEFISEHAGGTQVTLTAYGVPGAQKHFSGWSGACAGVTEKTCTVTMDGAKKVYAHFRSSARFTLNLNLVDNRDSADEVEMIALNGQLCHAGILGTIIAGQAQCYPQFKGPSHDYNDGDVVTLKAKGSNFQGWGGACSGAEKYCTVVMHKDTTVDAHFHNSTPPPVPPNMVTLHLEINGERDNVAGGKNAITILPGGAVCVFSCSVQVPQGARIALQFSPATVGANQRHAYLGRWSENNRGGVNPCDDQSSWSNANCVVTMDADKKVLADFWNAGSNDNALMVGYSGRGKITSAEFTAKIQCGETHNRCGDGYKLNSQVSLTAEPANGYTFAGWRGVCSGSHPVCVVNMGAKKQEATKVAHALFTPTAPGLSFPLAVALEGNIGAAAAGTVFVTSAPAGISCTASGCSGATFPAGTSVTLTPAPVSGYTFMGWKGACSGYGTCTVIMGDAQWVDAVFTHDASNPDVTLTFDRTTLPPGATVVSSPAGIHCTNNATASCSARWKKGTRVALTVHLAANQAITGWRDACAGTVGDTCMVQLEQDATAAISISNVNPPPGGTTTFALTASTTGNGSISSQPAGIDCGTVCSAIYNTGTAVTLTATPAAGHAFSGWGGACISAGSNASCTLTIDAAKTVSANFAPIPPNTYALGVGYTGDGSITSQPTGINCPGTCTASFTANTKVTLTPQPASGYSFSHWEGACIGSAACEVTMNAAKHVDAVFVQNATPPSVVTFALNVSKTGDGSISSQPAGIDCGTVCSATYNTGTTVTLTATPAAGHIFSGWSGACSGNATCVVTLDKAQSVHANFAAPLAPPPPPPPPAPKNFTLKVGYVGDGSITSAPAGIDCATNCSATYRAGTRVTLTATPAPGYHFVGWDSVCPGTTGPCVVTVNSDKFVDAIFAPNPSSQFTLSVQSTDGGNVTSTPAGIDCDGPAGSQCARDFAAGTQVTLTATAHPGFRFLGWSGACMAGSPAHVCVVEVNAKQTVSATFRAQGTSSPQSCQSASLNPSEEMILDAYIAYYGRPPEAAGLTWWSNHTAGQFHSAIDAFGNSNEFLRRFGSMSKASLIDNLYQQMFGRPAEAGGVTFYSNRLGNGQQSLASISLDIFYGARNADAQALENRRTVSRHFVTKTRSRSGLTISDVLLADWLSLVTDDRTSADDVCELLSNYIDGHP